MGAEEESVDSLISELLAWASSGRAAQAASARAHERSLVEQAAADSTWHGLLVDLAEAAAPVAVTTEGRQWSGRLIGVGRDFVVLERASAGPVLVALEAACAVTPSAAAGRPGGRREPALDLGLAGAIEGLAEQRSPVSVWWGAGSATGALSGLGRDYLIVSSDGGPRRPTFIPLIAVEAVELR
jgi:hypothetical protein